MKILFIGSDNFWIEGVKNILEDEYAEKVDLVSICGDVDAAKHNVMVFENYDFVFIDLMSYVSAVYGTLHSLLSDVRGKIVLVNPFDSCGVNVHSSLISQCIMVSMHMTPKDIKRALKVPFHFKESRLVACSHYPSSFKRTRGIKNAYEFEVIRAISVGEKVKHVATRFHKHEKTIYNLLSRIKTRMGFKSKHEFLHFLSTINSYEVKR